MSSIGKVLSFTYKDESRQLIFYFDDRSAIMYMPVPHFVHEALLKSADITAFYHKYIEYDLNFQKLRIE